MKINDKELEKTFLEIRQNKIHGIEELYNKYKRVIYGIAFTISKNKEDSEDIMQIIITKIYEMDNSKLPTNKYASWLYSITKNETINFLKKKKNDISLDKIYDIPNDNSELLKVVDIIEFNRLITKLTDKEKEIVSLKILSGFSFDEIANLLKEPVGTIKWRYYKSICSLKVILGNLTMFILSFIIGVKALFFNKQCENINDQEFTEQNSEVVENSLNSTMLDENINQDKSESYNSENTQEENIKQDIITNTNIIQDTNTTVQENTISEEYLSNNYNQYIGYGFLGISIIFLFISLYFVIKRHLGKSSK